VVRKTCQVLLSLSPQHLSQRPFIQSSTHILPRLQPHFPRPITALSLPHIHLTTHSLWILWCHVVTEVSGFSGDYELLVTMLCHSAAVVRSRTCSMLGNMLKHSGTFYAVLGKWWVVLCQYQCCGMARSSLGHTRSSLKPHKELLKTTQGAPCNHTGSSLTVQRSPSSDVILMCNKMYYILWQVNLCVQRFLCVKCHNDKLQSGLVTCLCGVCHCQADVISGEMTLYSMSHWHTS